MLHINSCHVTLKLVVLEGERLEVHCLGRDLLVAAQVQDGKLLEGNCSVCCGQILVLLSCCKETKSSYYLHL